MRLCNARLVDVTGPAVETFGVRATLVASADADPQAVHTLVAAVFDDLEAFKSRHPAYADLTPERMIGEGLSAPLHEGAKRYYRERGWLPDEAPDSSASDASTDPTDDQVPGSTSAD